MASLYPGSLDSLPTSRVTGNVIPASDHNDTADAVNKIEAELGTNPKGSAASVRARMEALESTHVIVRGTGIDPTGATDSRAAVQAKLDPLLTTGGVAVFPPGIYRFDGPLNLDDNIKGIRLEGASGETSDLTPAVVLRFTATGTAAQISCRASFGIHLKGLRIEYTSATYTGKLILLDWSGTVRDPAYFRMSNCVVSGQGTSSAAALVALHHAIICSIETSVFRFAACGIHGTNGAGVYSNVVKIDRCTFFSLAGPSIKNPGESWEIDQCTFEPRADGSSGAVLLEAGATAYSLTITNSWWGDITLAGRNWIDLLGSVLGLVVTGNRFSPAGSGANDGCLKITTGNGALIGGNRFEGPVGVEFASASFFFAPAIIGNDFQQAAETDRIKTKADARGLVALANTNLLPQVDDYQTLSLAAGLTLAGGHFAMSSVFAEIQWPDARLVRVQAGVVGVKDALQFTARSAASIPNNSIFLDAADNVLKQKNNAGVVSAI